MPNLCLFLKSKDNIWDVIKSYVKERRTSEYISQTFERLDIYIKLEIGLNFRILLFNLSTD